MRRVQKKSRGYIMHKSDLPDDYEIRVLLTIKNGVVRERRVKPAEMVATQEEFVMVLRQSGEYHGLIGSKAKHTRNSDGENITVQVPQGFSGRMMLNIDNGVLTKQTDIPQNYIFGSRDSLVELMINAGYQVTSPVKTSDNEE